MLDVLAKAAYVVVSQQSDMSSRVFPVDNGEYMTTNRIIAASCHTFRLLQE
jgi:hypothetical protein